MVSVRLDIGRNNTAVGEHRFELVESDERTVGSQRRSGLGLVGDGAVLIDV